MILWLSRKSNGVVDKGCPKKRRGFRLFTRWPDKQPTAVHSVMAMVEHGAVLSRMACREVPRRIEVQQRQSYQVEEFRDSGRVVLDAERTRGVR
jgi:trans-aconitate methyltransferase